MLPSSSFCPVCKLAVDSGACVWVALWDTNYPSMSQVCYDEDTVPAHDRGAENAGANGRESAASELQKPEVSYIEMIARAILDSPTKRLCLQDIYESIERNYPYFRTAHPGWRNSVRHNLSLHECFYKGERCENGKGHYWYVHPLNLEDFQRGDFRRRLVKARVRRMQSLCHPYTPQLYCSYAPLRYLVATTVPTTASAAALPLSYPTGTNCPLPAVNAGGFPFPTVAANRPLCISTQPLFDASSRPLGVPMPPQPAVDISPGMGATVGGYQNQVLSTTGVRLAESGPSSQTIITTAAAAFSSQPGFLFSVKNILSTQ